MTKFGFRDIFIFFIGVFTATWIWAFMQVNLYAEMESGIGVIVSLIFTFAYSHKSHEEKEMIKQWKNAKRMIK